MLHGHLSSIVIEKCEKEDLITSTLLIARTLLIFSQARSCCDGFPSQITERHSSVGSSEGA